MKGKRLEKLITVAIATALAMVAVPQTLRGEQRNGIAHPRTPYRLAFYNRHRPSYRVAGALHFAHSKLHDVLLLTPFQDHDKADAKLYGEILDRADNGIICSLCSSRHLATFPHH